MKILTVALCVFLFASSFILFAYAFAVPEEFAALVFFTGIMSASLSLAIPVHLMGRRQ